MTREFILIPSFNPPRVVYHLRFVKLFLKFFQKIPRTVSFGTRYSFCHLIIMTLRHEVGCLLLPDVYCVFSEKNSRRTVIQFEFQRAGTPRSFIIAYNYP